MLDVNMIIANNIQAELKKENKKQVDLAEGIGVSKQTMSKIMNGARAINAIELHKISEYLHVSMDSLMKMPEKLMDTNVIHAFMGRVKTEEARKGIQLADIYCYVENADQSYIKNGSMLDSATGDETGRTQEDLEANAFAGLLLMPDQLLHEQILLYGLDKDLVTVDSVLMLMDMFAMPYKAVVLRLFESGNISHQQAEKLLEVGSADVMERVSLTGKAKRWQLDGKGTESFGTLLEKVEYNRQHEYLTESREKEDVAYLTQLKKEYGLD